jgi:hypothetical protein
MRVRHRWLDFQARGATHLLGLLIRTSALARDSEFPSLASCARTLNILSGQGLRAGAGIR